MGRSSRSVGRDLEDRQNLPKGLHGRRNIEDPHTSQAWADGPQRRCRGSTAMAARRTQPLSMNLKQAPSNGSASPQVSRARLPAREEPSQPSRIGGRDRAPDSLYYARGRYQRGAPAQVGQTRSTRSRLFFFFLFIDESAANGRGRSRAGKTRPAVPDGER